MKEFKIKRYDHARVQKRKQGVRAAVVTVLLGAGALAAGWMAYPPVYDFVTNWEPPAIQTPGPPVPAPGPSSSEAPSPPPQEEPEEEAVFPAAAAYLPPEVLEDGERLERELAALREKGVEGVVFDLKDATGLVRYQSGVERVTLNRAQAENAYDLGQRLNQIRQAGMIPVGRLYAFRDRTATAHMYESAVKYMNSTVNWIDDSQANGGKPWLNPNNGEAQDYVIALVEEAAGKGVGTILLDGVQFPEGVALDLATYGNTGPLDKSGILAGFLARARAAGEGEGSRVAVTVNLISAAGLSDTRYGADTGSLLAAAGAGVVEVMPEQFGNGVTSEVLTLSSPALDPYKTVTEGIQAASAALGMAEEDEEDEDEEEDGEPAGEGQQVPLAAVIQAYTSTTLSQSGNKPYGPEEIQAQVRAARQAGIEPVIYLDPAGEYAGLE